MTMEDWSTRIDKYLLADDLDVLKDAKKISHDIAVDKALSEFEKYRIIQDKLFESDFDKFLNDIENNRKKCYMKKGFILVKVFFQLF